MSLYGNVKKVGSSTFQFDRQYNTRSAMDNAAATDGVYIGRYVLVEYGQRWVDTEGKNIDYTLIENQGAARLEGVVQSESFTNNANTDLQKYGATYDSTVWQKIYSDGTDKYIMVAELNAVTPRIEFIQEKPYLYRAPQEGEQQTDGIYYGTIDTNGYLVNAVEVKGAVEEFKKPSFDLGLDTELSYLLHLPTAVNLEVSNDTIDINSKGFDVAYSYGEKDKPSTIKWIPQGLNVDAQGNLTADSEVDTQKLYMNLTAFGDVMNTLYDLLYGKPNATPAELATGVLRPYFQQYRAQITESNRERTGVQVMVYNNNGELVPLQVETYKYDPVHAAITNITVDGNIGESQLIPEKIDIAKAGSDNLIFDPETDIYPLDENGTSIIQVCYQVGDEYFRYDKNSHSNPPNRYFYDTRVEPIKPLEFIIPDVNGDTDNKEWMQDIPDLNEILKNNTLGLASVLQRLFGYKDPFTGTVKYYLYNNWEAQANDDSSDPCIYNKPKVICGNIDEYNLINENDVYNDSIKYYTLSNDKYVEFQGDEDSWNENKNSLYTKVVNGDYKTDFLTWQIIPAT